MYAKVNISKRDEFHEIIITQNKSLFFKLIVWLLTLILLPAAIFFIILNIASEKNSLLLFTSLLVFFGIVIFVYKYNKSVYQKEKLIFSNKVFTYSNTFLGLGKYLEIKRKEIKKVKYVGYEKYIEHELKTVGDVLNFDSAQKEINYLNQEGTMLILSEYTNIRFGINVDMEDAQEIIRLVK